MFLFNETHPRMVLFVLFGNGFKPTLNGVKTHRNTIPMKLFNRKSIPESFLFLNRAYFHYRDTSWSLRVCSCDVTATSEAKEEL